MLLIYTPHITERARYVFRHIFELHFRLPYALTEDRDHYGSSPEPWKLSYDVQPADNGLYIHASGLLEETAIRSLDPQPGIAGGIPVLFPHDHADALGFDVFAAVFYMLSRYEEYLSTAKDVYGNFDYQQSVLYRMNALQEPVVEQWLERLENMLLEKYPGLPVQERRPRYALSFDVDVAWEYLHKGFIRTSASIARKLIRFELKHLKEQLATLFGMREDGFDTYEYTSREIKGRPAFFFFNMGDYGTYDKNPSFRNAAFRGLISGIHERYFVGLHPSFASFGKPGLVQEEKNRLEGITEQTVAVTRQHYLKLRLPDTYETLIDNGMMADFTMGYYFTSGFRAGTCNPFYFFNLARNQVTEFMLYPFIFMDRTLKDVFAMSIGEAKAHVSALLETVEKYNGLFIPLWHNSSLGNTGEWEGWREVFDHMLSELDRRHFLPADHL